MKLFRETLDTDRLVGALSVAGLDASCTCRRSPISEPRALHSSALHSLVFGDDAVLVAAQRLSMNLNLCDGIIVRLIC